MGLRDDVAATLDSFDILSGMPASWIVETLDEARRIARQVLEVTAVGRSSE